MDKLFKITVDGETFYVEIEEIQKKPTIKHIEKSPQEKPRGAEETFQKAAEKAFPVTSEFPEKVEDNHPVKQTEEYVFSPLPGKILSVNVKTGQKIKKGDLLFMIEAMKMENEILASHDSVIKNIYVKTGDYVETNAKLVRMERRL